MILIVWDSTCLLRFLASRTPPNLRNHYPNRRIGSKVNSICGPTASRNSNMNEKKNWSTPKADGMYRRCQQPSHIRTDKFRRLWYEKARNQMLIIANRSMQGNIAKSKKRFPFWQKIWKNIEKTFCVSSIVWTRMVNYSFFKWKYWNTFLFWSKTERIVKVLGKERSLQLRAEAIQIDENGGMLADGGKRRTKGGIYFQLVKHLKDIGSGHKRSIFASKSISLEKKQRKNQKKKCNNSFHSLKKSL